MTLIVYLVCLALLSFLLRNWSQRFRSLLITGFNLVFAALMFFSVQVHPGMTGGEVFALVGASFRQPRPPSHFRATPLFSARMPAMCFSSCRFTPSVRC